MFSNTGFCNCSEKDNNCLHKCLTDNCGAKLVVLRENTQSEEVRVSLCDLLEITDAKARGKYYNRHCLVEAMRTVEDVQKTEEKALYKISVEQSKHEIVAIVAQKVYNKGNIILPEVNAIFMSLLTEKGVKDLSLSYTKELKAVLEERLSNVYFTRPDYHNGWLIMLKDEVDMAVRKYCCDELTAQVIEVGCSLRQELLAGNSKWAVTDDNSFS